jgi:NAD(P)-dependent dehydrogenase (short-subunit alcohol dehydrogenase family)
MSFKGAAVVVTGGTSGIGAAIARSFVQEGASVTITGTRSGPKDYSDDLSAYRYFQLDVENKESIHALAQKIDKVDILINNGGISLASQGLDEWDPDNFDRSVHMHLTGVYRLSKLLSDKLAQSKRPGGAAIVGIASLSSFFGIEVVPGYGAGKTGLLGITRSMAVAWGRRNIRVNALAAGLIETRMGAEAFKIPGFADPTIARTPLGRIGTTQDVANAVLFLASPAASFITGQVLTVDGGFSIKGD